MTLSARITLFAQAVAGDVKAILGKIGNLANLTTTTKTDLVSALNELKSSINAAGASIDDTTASTTKTYSSSKINSVVNTAVSGLVASAPTALDTLNELASALGNDANFATTTANALGLRVRVDAVQSFTSAQQTQARSNIAAYGATEIGNSDQDFVSDYNTAKA